MIDSTSIRVTRAASEGGKKGTPRAHSLGRSRGGLTTKIHMVGDRHGWPLTFTLSPGQDSDTRHFIPAMENVHLPGTRGRPRKRCRYIVADKGYDSDPLRRYCDRHRMKSIIARRKMKRKPRPGAPRVLTSPAIESETSSSPVSAGSKNCAVSAPAMTS